MRGVRHPEAGGERAMKAAEAVAEACAYLGHTYQRLTPLDDILASNLKWLAGYRHPRNTAIALRRGQTGPSPVNRGRAGSKHHIVGFAMFSERIAGTRYS
ncbi:hypothetical protein [Streptomyces sp. NPDC014995]|uniref:hypothetical protein n=1 Tax=Streptomyces sp. NPDC014995 TaxID=3364936 RepID=UPI0036FB9FCE